MTATETWVGYITDHTAATSYAVQSVRIQAGELARTPLEQGEKVATLVKELESSEKKWREMPCNQNALDIADMIKGAINNLCARGGIVPSSNPSLTPAQHRWLMEHHGGTE